MKKILHFLFPGLEGKELNRKFIQEFPDAEPFFKGKLESPSLIATMDDLIPYYRYELWRTIKENMPKLISKKKLCQ